MSPSKKVINYGSIKYCNLSGKFANILNDNIQIAFKTYNNSIKT